MIKLFLSHASEDKNDFARPLAEALKPDFDVWFDEYELKVGDSLLKKINEGLQNCDYGIVVLSQAFFGKKWTRAELDGLFSLETSEKKIILPIWKGVGFDEVRHFSPILAGQVATSADNGIPKVVEEIKKAVGYLDRYQKIQESAWKKKFMELDEDNVHRQAAEKLSHSEKGVEQVTWAAQQVISDARNRADSLIKELRSLSLSTADNPERLNRDSFTLYGPNRVGLHFSFHSGILNSTQGATFTVAVIVGRSSYSNEKAKILDKFDLKGHFDRDLKVFWKDGDHTFTNSTLLDFIFEKFVSRLGETLKSNLG